MKKWSRKLGVGICLIFLMVAILAGCVTEQSTTQSQDTADATSAHSDMKEVNIGYQKFGTLNILKAEETLDQRLEELGIKINWVEFPAGPQLLEALNVGSIDFGHTGEAPPIFAQAAGAPIVYIANGPASPKGEAILVHKDSPIQTIEDLKGKKVVLNRGSNVHYLLVKALEEAGLALNDIEVIYLPPADARIAFNRGDVDAWVIWDPFFASAEVELEAKILKDGEGLVANREFFLSERSFAEANDDILSIILEELDTVDLWVSNNIEEAAEFLSPEVNIDAPVLQRVLNRRNFGVERVTESVLSDQQSIGDTFYQLELIPTEINIDDVTLKEENE
ncbi:sulfonate ABC transporter substrate-binding protein [Halalkalibacterium ligniniphilum]|uniref:sulfonate ABC transporter substrate-binding protein n=1 Tax=Halalkalibacterium ligniniphilum TaxID=1134413 RepID=UPI000346A9CD|nr:sulfonate ABC transporter substrate-binding protein [Halalkalibacterium ligniniphilum]